MGAIALLAWGNDAVSVWESLYIGTQSGFLRQSWLLFAGEYPGDDLAPGDFDIEVEVEQEGGGEISGHPFLLANHFLKLDRYSSTGNGLPLLRPSPPKVISMSTM